MGKQNSFPLSLFPFFFSLFLYFSFAVTKVVVSRNPFCTKRKAKEAQCEHDDIDF